MDDTGPWDLQRPDLLLAELQRQVSFSEPATYLVRVDSCGGVQHVRGWDLLWREPPLEQYPDRTRLAEEALQRLSLPGFELSFRERPLIVPVVVRPGPLAWTFDETEAMLALRYAANTHAFLQEGPLVVSGAGWWLSFADLSGREIRASWSPNAQARG